MLASAILRHMKADLAAAWQTHTSGGGYLMLLTEEVRFPDELTKKQRSVELGQLREFGLGVVFGEQSAEDASHLAEAASRELASASEERWIHQRRLALAEFHLATVRASDSQESRRKERIAQLYLRAAIRAGVPLSGERLRRYAWLARSEGDSSGARRVVWLNAVDARRAAARKVVTLYRRAARSLLWRRLVHAFTQRSRRASWSDDSPGHDVVSHNRVPRGPGHSRMTYRPVIRGVGLAT